MSFFSVLIVCLLSFIVSFFSVSVGGTSFITVPVLMSLGMVSKNAVATNMFALIFLSLSGAFGFRKVVRPLHHKMLVLFILLTVLSSLIGAYFIVAIDKDVLERVIAIIICAMVTCFLLKRNVGTQEKKEKISGMNFFIAGLFVFILGMYGGFFSGGYVTLLSYALIWILGLNFLQVASITKILNIFSSFVASAFFYYHGLVDFSVGMPLALFMSSGAFLGTRLAIAKGNIWVRNLFIIAVISLAIKLLFF